ncbi:hypothetical protein CXB51_016823 [Gossypium anomalum]|uniref:Reverse transcriptase Ty1/copia-type domain-containing protein n=1 Tax=Gossypium anomalum TaxID=47600 RepID=A0A8J6CVC1_9ROSI|nr:hypothetical protein CXB51_016823 [Gossypium anomalum]
MAITVSDDSTSVEHGCQPLNNARLVHSFPRHDILEDGKLVSNKDYSAFLQQDRLLTSWLLSTIHSSTEPHSASDVWYTATRLFAAVSGAKLSHFRHALYSIKKEKVEIVLVGLLLDFDVMRAVPKEVLIHVNFVEPVSSPVTFVRGIRPPFDGVEKALTPIDNGAQGSDARVSFSSRVQAGFDGSWMLLTAFFSSEGFWGASSLPWSSTRPYNFVDVGVDGFRCTSGLGLHIRRPASFGYHPGPSMRDRPAGPNSNIRPPVSNFPTGPTSNHVQFESPLKRGCDFGPSSDGAYNTPGLSIPWRTKPKARVYTGSDPCIGLLRIPDFHGSNFTESSGSHVNTVQFGSNGSGTDSYIHMLVGTVSWYPYSEATHHVCRDALALHEFTPYLGKASLLMGDGTATMISSIGNSVLPMQSKLLCLTNVFCVPNIRKNLLSVSQFGTNNDMFFEFYPTYFVVKDAMTWEILLTGHIRDGLYQFSSPVMTVQSSKAPVAAHIGLQPWSKICNVFSLWHKCLGHPSVSGLASVAYGDINIMYLLLLCVLDLRGFILFIKSLRPWTVSFGFSNSSKLSLEKPLNSFRVIRVESIDPSCLLSHLKGLFIGYLVHILPNRMEWLSTNIVTLLTLIVISRHVVFDESCFLSTEPTTESSVPETSPLVSTSVPLVKKVFSQPMEFSTVQLSESTSQPDIYSSPFLSNVPQCEVRSDREPYGSSVPSDDAVHSSIRLTTTTPSSTNIQASSLPITNNHPMVTRSKVGIFKPRVMSVEAEEPSTIEEAFSTSEWQAIAQAEYDALIHNSTWDLIPLPPNRKVIGCKWLFKIKKNPDGTIAQQKAHLVAKGYSQVPGCDFKETFSPVIKPTTIWEILSIAVSKGWQLRQVDVNNAFLNGDLGSEVFMHRPPGYVQNDSTGKPLKKYIRDTLDKSSMSHAKSVHTPMISSSTMSKDDGDRLCDPTEYRSLAGALQYVVLTRPDIAYAMPTGGWILMIGGLHRATAYILGIHLYLGVPRNKWFHGLRLRLNIAVLLQPLVILPVTVTTNHVLHSKFKHVELDLFFVREKVADGSVFVGEVPACD